MLVLFRRNEKNKPTRELNQEPPETTRILDKHRGNSEQQDSKKTLDDIGVPPPPPLSSHSTDFADPTDLTGSTSSTSSTRKGSRSDDLFSEYSETSEPEEMKPFISDLHETAQGEIPENYDEHIKELEDMHIIDTSKRAAVISSYGSQSRTEHTAMHTAKKQKTVTIPKKDLKKLHDSTRKIVQKLETDMNKQFASFEKKYAEMIKKNTDISRANVELTKTSATLMKENKDLLNEKGKLVAEYKRLHAAYVKTLGEQKKNSEFVTHLKSYLDPLQKREKKIIDDNTKITAQTRDVVKKFNTLLEVTKSVSIQNKGLGEEMDTIRDDHAILKKKHSAELESLKDDVQRIDTMEDDITRLRRQVRDLEKDIKHIAAQKYGDAIDSLKEDMKELYDDGVQLERIVKKLEEKVSILRDKVHLHKKSQK